MAGQEGYSIFVLGGADAGSEDGDTQAHGAQGDMPRGQRFGYIFGDRATDLGWLLAHELGHGVFTLKHLNEANYAGKSSLGTLPNLMDYTGSTTLAAFQWNVMANPAILTGLDGDDASKVILNLEVATYLNKIPEYHHSSPLEDDAEFGEYSITCYHAEDGSIVGYGASRNRRLEYIMTDVRDLAVFKKHLGAFSYAASLFYINGTPTYSQLKKISGYPFSENFWAELSEEWDEALSDPTFRLMLALSVANLGSSAISKFGIKTKLSTSTLNVLGNSYKKVAEVSVKIKNQELLNFLVQD